MDKRRRLIDLLALGSLVATTCHLGASYDSSIGFERPIHLSVLAVLLVSAVSFAIARLSSAAPTFAGFSAVPQEPKPLPAPVRAPTRLYDWARNAPGARFLLAAASHVSETGVGRALGRIPARVLLLASMVAWRVILFWHVTRFVHCSWSFIQYFLPLCVSFSDTALPVYCSRGLRLPVSRQDSGEETKQIQSGGTRQPGLYHVARTIGLALVWGLAATRMESYWENQTGTFCPRSSALGPSVSAAQLISLALDAAMLTMLSRTRMDGTSSRVAGGSSPGQSASSCCWGLLATACSISGALLL
ncbi:hypothetical protein RB597_005813 [Gaeumannomyces tritici]